MQRALIVALGGSIGAVARYLTTVWAAGLWGATFPYGTLIVNIVGCFIIGIFMTAITEKIIVHPHWRLFIIVGIVGGLTTFSSFSYETVTLVAEHAVDLAMYNVAANMMIGFAATWTGIIAARAILKTGAGGEDREESQEPQRGM